jgi:hypothetical protein
MAKRSGWSDFTVEEKLEAHRALLSMRCIRRGIDRLLFNVDYRGIQTEKGQNFLVNFYWLTPTRQGSALDVARPVKLRAFSATLLQ